MKEGGRRARDGDVTMHAMLGAMQRRAHEPRNVGHLKKLKKKNKGNRSSPEPPEGTSLTNPFWILLTSQTVRR